MLKATFIDDVPKPLFVHPGIKVYGVESVRSLGDGSYFLYLAYLASCLQLTTIFISYSIASHFENLSYYTQLPSPRHSIASSHCIPSSTSILSAHARLPLTTWPILSSAILYHFLISSSSPNPQAFLPAIEHRYGLFVRNFVNSVVCLIRVKSPSIYSQIPLALLHLHSEHFLPLLPPGNQKSKTKDPKPPKKKKPPPTHPPLKAPTGFLTGKGLSPTGATLLALIEKLLAAAEAPFARSILLAGVKMRDAIVINIGEGGVEISIALLRPGGGAEFFNWRMFCRRLIKLCLELSPVAGKILPEARINFWARQCASQRDGKTNHCGVDYTILYHPDNIFSRIESAIDQTFFNFTSLPLAIERNPNIRGN
ncbi:hypothetical protein EYC80_001281 [Monilinia laxa]|uniref:Uncharacterized protein n=1 Tax=Monilinia laxa TaxID=61186 RepID=A0A5N6K9P4_MONLA|nr:hypothetical protein EYC80_001281 [Monilinia laxa]